MQLDIFMPRGWSLSVSGNLSYTHRNNFYLYSTDIPTELQQDTKENAWNWTFKTFLSKAFGRVHRLHLSLWGAENINRLQYYGNVNSRISSNIPKFSASAIYSLSVQKLQFNLSGGATWFWNSIGDSHYREVMPTVTGNLRYQLNRRSMLNFYVGYFMTNPGISMKNPEILQQNEFMYTKGMADLKAERLCTSNLSYSWMPSNAFSLNSGLKLRHIDDAYSVDYFPYLDGRALLKSYSSGNTFNAFDIFLNCYWTPISKRLTFFGGVQPSFERLSGISKRSNNYIAYNLGAQGFIGIFTWAANFNSPERSLGEHSGSITKNIPGYSIYVGWHVGEVNLSLNATNFCNTGWKMSTTEYDSPLYSSTTTSYGVSGHARITLSATWTIGYGKEVQRGDEVKAIREVESAIDK